jgi:23S rRNA-/tRNA-specific pseudouridylate synthase
LTIEIAITQGLARAKAYAPPPDEGLQIVYQDEALIAINLNPAVTQSH